MTKCGIKGKTKALALALVWLLTWRVTKFHPSEHFSLDGWLNPETPILLSQPNLGWPLKNSVEMCPLSKLPITVAIDEL